MVYFLLFWFVIGVSVPVMAQDRIPEIPADKMTEAQKKAVNEFVAGRGAPVLGPFVPHLRAKAMGHYLRFSTAGRRAPSRLSRDEIDSILLSVAA